MHLFFLSWLVGAQPMDNMWELWLGQVVSIAMVGKVGLPIYRVSHNTGHLKIWLSPRLFINMNWTDITFSIFE